jgi:hypothetical protein
VLFIDNLEKIHPRSVPVLKSLVTSDGLRRHRLGTSLSTTIRQLATRIGTANLESDELVPDETGHRRFAMLTFRNGAVATGGDLRVWKAVDGADDDLLWRSVDAFGPCPIKPYLEDLLKLQAGSRRRSDLHAWLIDLDITRFSLFRAPATRITQAGRSVALRHDELTFNAHAPVSLACLRQYLHRISPSDKAKAWI